MRSGHLQVSTSTVTPVTAATRQRRLQQWAAQLSGFGNKSAWGGGDVHKLRICCKRWRSVVRLQPRRKRQTVWQTFDDDVRAVARVIGTARDQQVLIDTIELLAASATTAEQRAACTNILHWFPPPPVELPLPDELRQQVRALAATALQLPHALDKVLLGTLHKYYRRSRLLAQRALKKQADADTLHRFRKRVKYLYYQLELLSRHRHPLAVDLNLLGNMLGKIHDLHVLRDRIDKQVPSSTESGLVKDLLRQQLKSLRKAMRPVGKRCFNEHRLQ